MNTRKETFRSRSERPATVVVQELKTLHAAWVSTRRRTRTQPAQVDRAALLLALLEVATEKMHAQKEAVSADALMLLTPELLLERMRRKNTRQGETNAAAVQLVRKALWDINEFAKLHYREHPSTGAIELRTNGEIRWAPGEPNPAQMLTEAVKAPDVVRRMLQRSSPSSTHPGARWLQDYLSPLLIESLDEEGYAALKRSIFEAAFFFMRTLIPLHAGDRIIAVEKYPDHDLGLWDQREGIALERAYEHFMRESDKKILRLVVHDPELVQNASWWSRWIGHIANRMKAGDDVFIVQPEVRKRCFAALEHDALILPGTWTFVFHGDDWPSHISGLSNKSGLGQLIATVASNAVAMLKPLEWDDFSNEPSLETLRRQLCELSGSRT